jgi:uncharacterized protein YjbJ (UPF0337 family)
MFNHQTLQGNWNEIKGKLRSKWGELTDDDLQVFNGNLEQLVDTIQRKTGEAREGIEQFFEQFNSNGASGIGRAGETVRACAQQAAETFQETSKQAAESVREGYAEVEKLVRQRPAESLVVCLGVGVITGVVVGLIFRSR